MIYEEPNRHGLDIYCCRNPYCRRRMRTVSVASEAPKHCGIPTKYIGTMTKMRWEEIRRETTIKISAIIARQEAIKHAA